MTIVSIGQSKSTEFDIYKNDSVSVSHSANSSNNEDEHSLN